MKIYLTIKMKSFNKTIKVLLNYRTIRHVSIILKQVYSKY